MKTIEDARRLAQEMVEIGRSLGRRTIAVLSDMNQPLGREVGNANEIREAIMVLKGEGEERLTKLCLTVAEQMVMAAGLFSDPKEAEKQLNELIQNGAALEKLKTFVKAQGGDADVIDHPEQLPMAKYALELTSKEDGYISAIDAESVGLSAMLLGAGRKTKEDQIDHGVGISLKKKVGDPIKKGETLAVLYSNSENAPDALSKLESAYHFSVKPVDKNPIIYDIIK